MSSEIFWTNQEIYFTEVFWPLVLVFLVLLPVLGFLFILGFFRRYRLWNMGKPGISLDQLGGRLKTTLAVAFGQMRTLREIYPGLMHLLIFWGSLFLILGKIIRLFSFAVVLTHPPKPSFCTLR